MVTQHAAKDMKLYWEHLTSCFYTAVNQQPW